MTSDIYRDGKVYVCAEMCATCVFRPGNLMELKPGRLKGMSRDATAQDSVIPCHSTLYGQQDHQAICRGFFNRYADRVLPLRLARMLDMVEEQAC